MTKIAISQPTFLPWCGYIALINYIDEFVFLDNVQFEKRSWQQRNYIKSNSGKLNLTIPVISKNFYQQKINDVKIDYSNKLYLKIIKSIEQNYNRAPFFNDYANGLFKILELKPEKLIDLNILLIKWICEILSIDLRYSFSSQFKTKSRKEQLIYDICKQKNADKYISTIGSMKYLKEQEFFKFTGSKLYFFKYQNKEYDQLYGKYIENLSIIDLLFNCGLKSKEILRKNFVIV